MIDIHSHILPSIDDGSKSIEETLKMIKQAIEDGTTDIVATPHYCIGYGEEPFTGVKEKVKELNKILCEKKLGIKVHYGQEVYYSNRLLEDLEEETIGTINDGRYLLIEFNMRELEEEVFDTLYELGIQNVVPVIAHPERYSYIQKHPSTINKFIDEGCLFQLNAGSIEGRHGSEAKKCAELLLKNGVYSFIGSDGHNIKNRLTGVSKGILEAQLIDEGIEEVFKENGMKLLNNEKVEFQGSIIEKRKRKKKRGLFSFLKK